MTFFSVGSYAVAHDDHEVVAVEAFAHGGFDAAVGGAADHDDRGCAAIVHNGFELVADEHARAPLIDDDIIIAGLERLHDLPAEAAVQAARFELARMINLLIFHPASNPNRCFVFP